MKQVTARVPAAPRYRPLVVEPAYADPDAVLRLVQDSGPYDNLAGMAGYGGFNMPTMPWFRALLTPGEGSETIGTGIVLDNPAFVEAARQVFDAEIVRPKAATLNIMTAQGDGAAHVDTASFRGSFPTSSWLLSVMGASGLFDRWAIRVPAALTWFYPGDGGGYEYWPDGPARPSTSLEGPFGNIALVGDNDYMYHRVRGFGDVDRYADVGLYSSASTITFDGDDWIVSDQGAQRVAYAPSEVRISLLWRGMAFADGQAARIHDGHHDDLDTETMVAVFLGDLADRGISCATPTDPLSDQAWTETLNGVYGMGGLDFGQ